MFGGSTGVARKNTSFSLVALRHRLSTVLPLSVSLSERGTAPIYEQTWTSVRRLLVLSSYLTVELGGLQLSAGAPAGA
jgi:hypothetical protein